MINKLFNRSAHSAGPNRGGGPWGVLGVPWGSLRVIGGSLEVAGGVLWLCRVPAGVPGRSSGGPGGSLGVPGGSLGVPGGVPGRPRRLLGEGPGGSENTSSFLRVSGGVQGGPWGDFGRLGWSSEPPWEVQMLIFL